MTALQQPTDANNPIVYLDIQIGLENGKQVFCLLLISPPILKWNHFSWTRYNWITKRYCPKNCREFSMFVHGWKGNWDQWKTIALQRHKISQSSAFVYGSRWGCGEKRWNQRWKYLRDILRRWNSNTSGLIWLNFWNLSEID